MSINCRPRWLPLISFFVTTPHWLVRLNCHLSCALGPNILHFLCLLNYSSFTSQFKYLFLQCPGLAGLPIVGFPITLYCNCWIILPANFLMWGPFLGSHHCSRHYCIVGTQQAFVEWINKTVLLWLVCLFRKTCISHTLSDKPTF